MAERGIDIVGRPTKHFNRFARSRFNQIVTLCDKVKEVCPELPGHPTTAYWSIADPSAEAPRTTTRASFAPLTRSRSVSSS